MYRFGSWSDFGRVAPYLHPELDRLDPINRDLRGLWLLNEGRGGVAHDLSPFRHHGTLANFPAYPWLSAVRGHQALFFDGSDDFVDLGTAIGKPASYTISVFVRPSSHGHSCIVFGADSSASNGSLWGLFGRSSGNVEIYVSNGSTLQAAVTSSSWERPSTLRPPGRS